MIRTNNYDLLAQQQEEKKKLDVVSKGIKVKKVLLPENRLYVGIYQIEYMGARIWRSTDPMLTIDKVEEFIQSEPGILHKRFIYMVDVCGK